MRRLIVRILCIAPFLLAAPADAVIESVSYAATRVMRIDGYELVTEVHHAPHMERITAELAGFETSLILRSDRSLVWHLIPLLGIYGESDISEMDTPDNVEILSREPLGAELVQGQPAVKHRALFRTRGGTTHEGFYWENADGVHVRSEFTYIDAAGEPKRMELELSNVKVGPQPAHLFEVPDGYRKVDIDLPSLLPM